MESTTSPAKRHHPKRLRIIEAKHPLPGAIVSGAPGDLVGLGIGHRVEDLRHLLGDHPVEPGLEQVLVDPYDVQGSWFRLLASNRGFLFWRMKIVHRTRAMTSYVRTGIRKYARIRALSRVKEWLRDHLQENVRSPPINTMMPNDDVPEAPIILAITVPPREIRTANTRVGRTDFWYANCRRDVERRIAKAIRYEAPPFVSSSDSVRA